MTAAINSTGAGKRGYPTKSSVPETQASTQRRARERSVAIQTLLLVRKSKSSSVKSRSEERFSRNAETDLVCRLLLEKKKKNNLSNTNTERHTHNETGMTRTPEEDAV